MKYTYVIFDFDGTLANSVSVQNKILNELAVNHHFDKISAEDFKNRDNLTLYQKAQLLWLVITIQSEFKALYNENIANVKPFDGLLSMLPLLQDHGYKIVIISSNAEENISKFLKQNNFTSEILIISTKGIFGKQKAFAKFVKQQQCSTADILYIGDEIRDVKACNKSGVDVAFVKWGLDADKDLTSYNIKLIVSSPSELQQLLITTL